MQATSAARPAGSIVVLTGAGISAASGLPTFRGAGGLWEGRRVEEVASPRAFARQPELVHRFYNERRRKLLDPAIRPNAAHIALVRLEREWPGEVLIVTQNVDDLHERAGSRSLLHLHGELLRVRCTACGHRASWRDDLLVVTPCPECGAPGRLRPDIVWFGEMPRGLDEIERRLAGCTLFVAIGTSGLVYPAADFVAVVRRAAGARTILLNLEPTSHADAFAECRHGPAEEVVPRFVDELLAGD